MTAYRYVRTGRLPARKSGGVWRVRAEDLDLVHDQDAPADRIERLADRLAADDEAGALRIATEARSAREPWRLHHELLAPALLATRVEGPDSLRARRASSTLLRVLGHLAPLEPARDHSGSTVAVAGPEADHDRAAVALFADLLRVVGHDVIDLGPHTPNETLAEIVATEEPATVVVVSDAPEEVFPGAVQVTLGDLIPQHGQASRYASPSPISVAGGQETVLSTLFGPLTGPADLD